jgi:hypothetical protein
LEDQEPYKSTGADMDLPGQDLARGVSKENPDSLTEGVWVKQIAEIDAGIDPTPLINAFPKADIYFRTPGRHTYALGVMTGGCQVLNAAGTGISRQEYIELTCRDILDMVDSGEFQTVEKPSGGKYAVEAEIEEPGAVFVFQTDEGRYGKMIVDKCERTQGGGLNVMFYFSWIEADFVVYGAELDPPAGLTYDDPQPEYAVGTAIQDNMPSSTGGTIWEYDIEPGLPKGLEFSHHSGAISGTPEEAVTNKTYTVTGWNPEGETTAQIEITIHEPPRGLTYTETECSWPTGASCSSGVPGVTGGVTGWSIEPRLPQGLTIGGNGEIAGTPTEVTSRTSYTVTAIGEGGGETTADLYITTPLGPPLTLGYANATQVATVGTPITSMLPTVTGGTVSTWEVSPALPQGLTMDPDTGVISGTPGQAQSETKYTVKARNTAGYATAEITLTIN